MPRENATILNAAILAFARKTIKGFRLAMSKLDLSCPLYLTQNDGTLTDAAVAAELPIKTFASGPTNSLMGAAFLQGLDLGDKKMVDKQFVVVDIGGTVSFVFSLGADPVQHERHVVLMSGVLDLMLWTSYTVADLCTDH